MIKTTSEVTIVEFILDKNELEIAIDDFIEDKYQVLGYEKNTTYDFTNNRCIVKTIHYGCPKDDTKEEIK